MNAPDRAGAYDGLRGFLRSRHPKDMITAIRSRAPSLLLVGAALAALYLVLVAIVGSAMFSRAPEHLAAAVTFDLTVTATAIVWWFGVRRGALPGWTVLAVFGWGVTAARAWVPHAPLGALLVVGGAVEVVSVSWLVLRIRRVVRVARSARDEGPIGSIEAGLTAIGMPARLATIIASELAVVGLASTGWFRRPAAGALSMRSTGWILFAGVFGFLVVVESAVTHVVIAHWSPLAAWIATASTLYALVWLIGDAQAIRLYPVTVSNGMLHLRLGVRWRSKVPLAAIASIDEIRAVPEGAVNLALIEPTVLVTLRAPIELRGLLGKRRTGDRIALTIDDPKALIAAVAVYTAGG
jgi:hypothetical protein